MPYNVNSDNRLADVLVELKRHIRVCRGCQSAIKVRDRSLLCDHVTGLILTAVTQFDTVIPRRIAAKRKAGNVFYACPDLAAHGKTWAMSAEPLTATGVQERLF